MKGFLDSRRLRYFAAIAGHGSISAAARSLNVAQPALSHHMSALERQIGSRLLTRRHDGVSPTEAGLLLLRHARAIIRLVDLAEEELIDFASDLGGHGLQGDVRLRLAMISSLAAELAPSIVRDIACEMPGVTLRISEAATHGCRAMLSAGDVDAAVQLAPEGPVLAMERLHFVQAAGAGEDDGEDDRAAPFEEVTRQPLVLPACGTPLRDFVEAAAAGAGLILDVPFEIDGAASRRTAILAGLGATILGAHSVLAQGRHPRLLVRPIVEPTLVRPIHLATRRALDPHLAAQLTKVLRRSLGRLGHFEPGLTAPAGRAAARSATNEESCAGLGG